MAEIKTILLVEDDTHLNTINCRALEGEGYTVLTALNLAQARERLAANVPDAIVLDVKLPDGNGFDFCREIRESIASPILFLTSVRDYSDELTGLRAGGDDYLKKPFDINLMLARIASFLRRDEIVSRIRPPESVIRGLLKLDIVSDRAYRSGEDMLLTQKEFALLLLLVRNEGRILSKEYLFENVWKLPVNDDARAVKAHLSNVRKKIEGSGYVISSVRGEGYCFEKE